MSRSVQLANFDPPDGLRDNARKAFIVPVGRPRHRFTAVNWLTPCRVESPLGPVSIISSKLRTRSAHWARSTSSRLDRPVPRVRACTRPRSVPLGSPARERESSPAHRPRSGLPAPEANACTVGVCSEFTCTDNPAWVSAARRRVVSTARRTPTPTAVSARCRRARCGARTSPTATDAQCPRRSDGRDRPGSRPARPGRLSRAGDDVAPRSRAPSLASPGGSSVGRRCVTAATAAPCATGRPRPIRSRFPSDCCALPAAPLGSLRRWIRSSRPPAAVGSPAEPADTESDAAVAPVATSVSPDDSARGRHTRLTPTGVAGGNRTGDPTRRGAVIRTPR